MGIPKYIELFRKDLILKNYAETSIENYVSQVKLFLHKHEQLFTEPAKINETAIKDWLLTSQSVNGRKHRISALKLFYKFTIKQPMKLKYIEYPRSEKNLPIVLSQEEVQRMFDACKNTKHLVIMALLYSCGLRVSELINLQWSNIDRSRKIINIIKAKGFKDRQVPLAENLIPLLERYWKEYKSVQYILNGQTELQYTAKSVGEVVKQLAQKAGINKRVYTHLLRHCSFTHLLENGIDISLIQKIAGHASPKTTSIYTHISHNLISKVVTPFNQIKIAA
jgi:site-specific recombinase XerD